MQHLGSPPHPLPPAEVLHGAPFRIEPLRFEAISGKGAGVLRSLFVAMLLAAALAVPALAHRVAVAQEARHRLIVVEIDPGSSGVDPQAVRQAIANELGVDVADQTVDGSIGTLFVRVADGDEATVRFRAPDGQHSIERSVKLPQDPALRHEAIALLAGNLARDEAKELAEAIEAAREARRLEKERQAREAAEAVKVAEAARAQRLEAETRKQAAARAAFDAQAAAKAAAQARAEAAARARGEESRGNPAPPEPKELHDRINERVEEQSGSLARYDEYELEPFQAALVPSIAIYPKSDELRFHGMLSLLYVDAGGIEGGALAVGVHRIRGNVRGAQAAGVWNDVKGLHYGAQVAGIGNRSDGPLRGAEGAGILNLRAGAVQGGQWAGIVNLADAVEGVQSAGIYNGNAHELLGAQWAAAANYSGGDAVGAQAAGGVNIAGGHVEGVQVAGVANVAKGSVKGAQAAGAANLAEGNVEGAQIAGAANVAKGSVDGVQIAAAANVARDVDGAQIGLVNVGRDVAGTQIGLVNVSREMKGFPIGLVNISKTGRYQLVMWHERKAELNPDTVGAGLNVGVKFLAGNGYTEIGFGGDARDSTWSVNAALGAHFPIKPLFIEIDAMYRGEWDARASNENDAQAMHYRGKLGVEIIPKRFGVFVGGGLRQAFLSTGQQTELEFSPIALVGVQAF